ncbi:MAG: PTS sugar transporter subunit IIA [Spirochaetales bacterium]|nr:PTS sugar transporter subunit IIA [Spirochaetales bacterium]
MDLVNIIDRECCSVLQEKTKTEVIIELTDRLVGRDNLDIESLKKELFYREQLMSTGIGLGLAVPHVRFKGVKSPVVIAGVQPEGIADYESLDGEPVKIVIMIIVGEAQHKEHIRLLSMIVGRLKNAELRTALVNAESGDEIYSLLTGEAGE